MDINFTIYNVSGSDGKLKAYTLHFLVNVFLCMLLDKLVNCNKYLEKPNKINVKDVTLMS